MGVKLAEALTGAVEAATTDERDRAAVLTEAATASGLQVEEVERLLQPETRLLPEESTLTKLVEAVGADAGTVQAARASGDWFEGDELPEVEGRDEGAVILEAVGDGAPIAGKGKTRRYRAVIIRPGRAVGPGRRYYGTKMLEANAANFGGQPVFFNHEDMATILKRGHGSRDPRHLAGYVVDNATFDRTYSEPDDAKNGRKVGAVMADVDFLLEAADLVDALPDAVKLSVCMDPTKVRVGRTEEGGLAPLVEGVVKQSGSVDLITGKSGAGGRVLEQVAAVGQRLQEAAERGYAPAVPDDLEEMDDAAIVEAARSRPAVLEALRDPTNQEPNHVSTPALTPEALAELLGTDEGKAAMAPIVEAATSAREEQIREEAAADAQRRIDLRDFRDEAGRLVESSDLLKRFPSFGESVRERYSLIDGVPSAALDLYDDVDGEGKVTKSALAKLTEAVSADVAREEAKIREANPTVVRGVGGQTAEGERDALVEAGAGNGGGEGGEGGEGKDRPKSIAEQNAERMGVDPARVRRHQGRN